MAAEGSTRPDYLNFQEWTEKYDKKYDSEEERSKRRKLWEQNFEMVQQHNKDYFDGKHSYRIQQTRCSDQALEEKLSWMSCSRPRIVVAGAAIYAQYNRLTVAGVEVIAIPNPESVNWDKAGFGTKVKNQYETDTCWIFSAVSAVESHNKIVNGELIELSVQQLVDCMQKGFEVGYPEDAFLYIKDNGSIRESDYPQSIPFEKNKCMSNNKPVAVRIDGWKRVSEPNSSYGEHALETVVAKMGPVVVTLHFSNPEQLDNFHALAKFEDDIFSDPHGGNFNEMFDMCCHSVLVVGYGFQKNSTTNETEKYWIVKNSWGTKENSGYHKITKGNGNNCYIACYAVCPVVPKVNFPE